MRLNPKFITATLWAAAGYALLMLLLIIRSILKIPLNSLVSNTIRLVDPLLLILQFIFVIDILRKLYERKFIVLSYGLFPLVLAITSGTMLFIKPAILSPVVISLGVLNVITHINLLIQSFRLKRSVISAYCRNIALVVFTVLAMLEVVPVLSGFVTQFDRIIYIKIIGVLSLVDLALHMLIPLNIYLMIRKIKNRRAAAMQQKISAENVTLP